MPTYDVHIIEKITVRRIVGVAADSPDEAKKLVEGAYPTDCEHFPGEFYPAIEEYLHDDSLVRISHVTIDCDYCGEAVEVNLDACQSCGTVNPSRLAPIEGGSAAQIPPRPFRPRRSPLRGTDKGKSE